METFAPSKAITALFMGLSLSIGLFAQIPDTRYKVLYRFQASEGGWSPYTAGVTFDSAGNLYGTTEYGGAGMQGDNGVVYKLDTAGNYTVLYNFCSLTDCSDGSQPYAGVILDSAGNLYGTTVAGGAFGRGVVFKLDTAGQFSVLHSFDGGADGSNPTCGLALDSAGNLFGTATSGGTGGGAGGVVFKLDTANNYTVLYNFCGLAGCTDGAQPLAGVTIDSAGNLYGTTRFGGGPPHTGGYGVVYKLDTAGNYTVLYDLTNSGAYYVPGVILDSAGNLYGTTAYGGTDNHGVVFKVDTAGNYTVLYNFCSLAECADGSEPYSGVILDSAGNLYGSTYLGGITNDVCKRMGCGTVFRLDTKGNLTTLHSFVKPSGGLPYAGLIQDSKGDLYGTTDAGEGLVFKLKP